MIDIIAELAMYVQVPAKHIEENRASPGIVGRSTSVEELRSQIFVKSSKQKPEDAFLTVTYRDYWFYIDDTDFRSKRMFSFLIFLLSLAESGPKGLSPVLTLPTG